MDKYAHISDQELLNHFHTDQNNEWIGVLLQRYTMLLLGVCMKYLKNEEEAKDAVQQVFLKAITELPKYKVDYFKSWIYMVAKNHCLMKLRDSKGKIPVAISERMPLSSPEEPDRSVHLENERTLSLLSDCLQELNPEQQQCVTLFYLQKKSYQEIAGHTGYTMMQVKSYIQNGKRNLKIIMERKMKSSG